MATMQPNHRASLLSGLRTGGVRSVSVPHTAAPTGSFNVPRVPSSSWNSSQNVLVSDAHAYSPEISSEFQAFANVDGNGRQPAVDAYGRRYSLQPSDYASPQPDMYLNSVNNGLHATDSGQLQMQLMQLELMKIQALAQMQQLAQAQAGATSAQYPHGWYPSSPEPVTASAKSPAFAPPMTSPLNLNRYPQAHSFNMNDAVPMTAALGGRFGSRSHQELFQSIPENGTSNYPARNLGSQQTAMAPSKSDAAASWRRGNNVEQVEADKNTNSKSRPKPLRFSQAIAASNTQAVSYSDESEPGDDSSSSKSDEQAYSSSPTTPLSNDSGDSVSTREEASKKLFQGLGIGRPSIQVTPVAETVITTGVRSVSQLIRQPRGPPSASEELRDKNFVNRIRKRAIGGLGILMEARERRDSFQEATI